MWTHEYGPEQLQLPNGTTILHSKWTGFIETNVFFFRLMIDFGRIQTTAWNRTQCPKKYFDVYRSFAIDWLNLDWKPNHCSQNTVRKIKTNVRDRGQQSLNNVHIFFYTAQCSLSVRCAGKLCPLNNKYIIVNSQKQQQKYMIKLFDR